MTPEAVRAQRHIDNLAIVEPIAMTYQQLPKLEPPRFEQGKALLLAGVGAAVLEGVEQAQPVTDLVHAGVGLVVAVQRCARQGAHQPADTKDFGTERLGCSHHD